MDRADWAVLDPELTLGLPAAVTAAAGIDAMVHAIEPYTSRYKKNLMSDQLARQALSIRRPCELECAIHTSLDRRPI